MRKAFQFMLVCLLPLVGISQNNSEQNFDIKIGKPYRVIDSPFKEYLEYEDVMLSFKLVKDELIVQKFNTKTLVQESIKTYSDFPDKFVIENIAILKNKCYLFFSLWDKIDENEQLFFRELDIDKGTFVEKGKLLFKVNGKVTGQMAGNGKLYGIQIVDKFKFEESFDDSHLMIKYRKKPGKRNDDKSYDEIGFHVYDFNLNELWTKEIQMPYHESQMDNLDYYVNEMGDCFILTTVFKDHSGIMKLEKGVANYHIELLKIEAGSDQITKTPIQLKSSLINSISLFQGKDNELVMGGYYSDKDIENVDGIFSFSVDDKGVIANKFMYEFPVDFLNENASNKEVRKNERKDRNDKAEMSFLSMKKIVAGDDGSVTLIGEKAFTKTSQNGKMVTISYYFLDMIVSKIDSAGNLVWNKKLAKRQVGRDGVKDMSFEHFIHNNNHYFLFMDNIHNKNLSKFEPPKAHSSTVGGWLTAYVINSETGAVSKTYFLDSREVNGIQIAQFGTDRIIKTDEGDFVFEVYKKDKQDVLIKVNLEE